MSVATETTYDVFLSHGAHDTGIAGVVTDAFSAAGLETFAIQDVKSGKPFLNEMRRKLAECRAVVMVLTRSTLGSSNVAFEVGAAMAWNKPIYVIYEGIAKNEIPEFLQGYPIRQVGDIDRIVREISESQQPFSEEDRDSLIQAYQELGVPADQLLLKPLALHELAEKYNSIGPANFAAERLVQELIRLRKQGRLPTKIKKA